MESAPVDDEPFTDEDEAALAESYDELAAADTPCRRSSAGRRERRSHAV
jgi:hypothetical protein